MRTTNLFVELFVIGMGAAIWIFILVLIAFGYAWLDVDFIKSWNTLLPIVAFVYVLGIVVDRTADTLLRKPDRKRRDGAFYNASKDYHYVRTYVFYQSEKFKDIFDYARSKLRICRAWVFNFGLIGFETPVFVWTRLSQYTFASKVALSGFCAVACFLLAYGSWYTWHRMTRNYYVRLLDAYEVISEIKEKDTVS